MIQKLKVAQTFALDHTFKMVYTPNSGNASKEYFDTKFVKKDFGDYVQDCFIHH